MKIEKEFVLFIISTILIFFSTFASLIILYFYIIYSKIRTFTLKLIAFLMFSEIISNIGKFITIFFKIDVLSKQNICNIQGFFIIYGILSSLAWIMLIYWMLYITIVKGKNYKNFPTLDLIILGFLFPLIYSLM